MGGPCDYCVSPSPKNWVFGFFRLGVRIWGLLGQGIRDLDSGLTINEELFYAAIKYQYLPKNRILFSMLAALRSHMGLGSAVPNLQLPTSGSKISVESVKPDPLIDQPPLTRNIFIN